MEILNPPPVYTFLNELQIVDHSADTTYTLMVASFETILSIKQKITMQATDKLEYLPDSLFLAIKNDNNTYTPIEFQYVEDVPIPNQFPDPLSHPPPDRRFVTAEGADLIVSREPYPGLTFQTIPFRDEPVLHLWTLRSLAAIADPTNLQEFIGFFQIYFPALREPNQVEETLHTSPSRDTTDILTKLQTYQTTIQSMFDTIESILSIDNSFDDIEQIQLNHITQFHVTLPPLASVEAEGLDVLFHTMKGSKYLPYIRYFPQRGVPTLKLGRGPSGIPLITNTQILGLYMMDVQDVQQGSVLLIKIPIEIQDIRVVQKGFAWSLLIYEDGHAEAKLDALRTNDPIPFSYLERAFELLFTSLTVVGWEEHPKLTLSLFSGDYEINVDSKHVLTNKELQARLKQYTPLFYEEPIYSKLNGIAIRSRMGTLLPQEDPIQQAVELYHFHKQTKQVPQLLLQEFGISSKRAGDAIKQFAKQHQEQIDTYGEPQPVLSDELGATLYIENQSPRYIFQFHHITSYEELQQVFTIAKLMILPDKKTSIKESTTPTRSMPSGVLSIEENEENAFAAVEEEQVDLLAPAKKDTYDYVNYLIKADQELFKFTVPETSLIGTYTTSCQKAQHRQPYVVSPNKYKDIKQKYEGMVHMLEYPLSDYNAEVVKFVSSTAKERKKDDPANPKTKKEREAMEIHALRMGVPLKGDVSFLGEKAPPMLMALIEEQKQKELWVFARAGVRSANYYICSKLWCATDQLPILQSEYEGTTLRNGAKKKLIPSCPFCGEQNVIERKGDNIYVGYFSEVKHPKQYILPCCFTSPSKVSLPKDAIPIPDPPKGLEPVYPEPLELVDESSKKVERLKDLGDAFKKLQSSSTYFLRSNQSLTEGSVGFVPEAIDTILGQSIDSYTTLVKGYPRLNPSPHAFIRFGISGNLNLNGQNFLQFLSYSMFACARIGQGVSGISTTSTMCPVDTLKWICTTNMVKSARAFEAANYGTLIHEFHNPEEPDPGSVGSTYTALEFQTWMGLMKLETADRAYVVRFFKAWKRFIAYLSDSTEKKELRLWDGFLSTPGLFSKSGILLLRVIQTKEGKGDILCPPFGISQRTRDGTPCILPIYHMEEQSIIEPLIYVETNANFVGAIHPSILPSYSKDSREKLKNLYYQFLQPILGCGRPVPPINVWLPLIKRVLQLGQLLDRLKPNKQYVIKSILRERTNRAVGVIVDENSISYYIPISDDGTIDTSIPCSYGIEQLPTPSYPQAFDFFTKLSKEFPFLKPSTIRYKLNNGKQLFAQIDLENNSQIPIASFEEGLYPITLPMKEQSDYTNQEEDSILLKKADEESIKLMNQVEVNPEELMEEAYQYLRLSLSNWLIRTGHGVAKQIELLRAARNRLPLYELRKRGDLLLHGLIKSWITTSGSSSIPPLLRQDCLLLKEGDCHGICGWSDGRCKIHTPTYGTVEDPSIILTARLVDELLRTNGSAYEVLQAKEKRVLRFRSPSGLTAEEDAYLLSFEGRGTKKIYEDVGLVGRHPTKYTEGYTYPEEISAEVLGRTISTESGLPQSWEDGGWSRSGELFDIVRKLPELRDALLRELLITSDGSTMTYTTFEKELQRLRLSHSTEPFTWSVDDLHYLSKILEVNIILTKKHIRTGMLEFKEVIADPSSQYLLLDGESLPLLYKEGGVEPTRYVTYEQLPEDIQIALERM